MRGVPRARPRAVRSAEARWLARERRPPRDLTARRCDAHARVSGIGVLSRLPSVRAERPRGGRQVTAGHVQRMEGEPLRGGRRAVPGLPHARPAPPLARHPRSRDGAPRAEHQRRRRAGRARAGGRAARGREHRRRPPLSDLRHADRRAARRADRQGARGRIAPAPCRSRKRLLHRQQPARAGAGAARRRCGILDRLTCPPHR